MRYKIIYTLLPFIELKISYEHKRLNVKVGNLIIIETYVDTVHGEEASRPIQFLDQI